MENWKKWFFVIVVMKICTSSQEELDYLELQNLSASCYPSDSCRGTINGLKVTPINCDCESTCIEFGTCCIDSPSVRRSTKVFREPKYKSKCEQLPYIGIETYIVSTCAPGWRGDQDVKSMCETPTQNMADPMAMILVTHKDIKITFRNFFCALCNNVEKSLLDMWDLKIDGFDMNFLSQKFNESRIEQWQYNATLDRWGMNLGFIPIDIQLQPPNGQWIDIPRCLHNMVSKCDGSWTDDVIKRKCESYMAVVYFAPSPGETKIPYRNIHCAICNYHTAWNSSICHAPVSGYGGSSSPSIGILMNVNTDKGITVGKADGDSTGKSCKDGDWADPFHGDCRTPECVRPGYQKKDGKCVRKS